MHGKLTSVKPAALQKKRENRNAVALDSEQNPVQQEDVVKVNLSPYSQFMFPSRVGERLGWIQSGEAG